MKFGKQLAAQQVPVWARFYIDYKGLKKIINSLAKGRPADAALLAAGYRPPSHTNANHNDVPQAAQESAAELHAAATSLQRTPSSLHPEASGESALLQAHKAAFFFKLERELEKINAFYLQKESEFKSRMRALIDKRKTIQTHLGGTLSRESAAFNALYDGLRYFERDLSKLQNYVEMNATGFRKILKKWDKRSKSSTKELYLSRQVDVQPCFNREVISELSDTAAANIRKLEGLCTPRGGEHTIDPAADGILSERKINVALSATDGQDDVLSDLETELIAAIRAKNKHAVDNIMSGLPNADGLDNEVHLQLARIFWRAAISEDPASPALLDRSRLNFTFVDDINGRTPLITSAVKGRLDLVRLCIDNGIAVGHRDIYGREALHYAAMVSREVCSYLIQQGASVDAIDFDGQSPLIYAILHGEVECVRSLIRNRTSSQRPAGESVLPLSQAAKQGVVPIVSLLLEHGHAIVPDASGFLPQHIAAKEGHVEVLDILLRAGASIDAQDKFANWTPLFHAANEGHIDCVRALMRAGASVTAIDDQGKTALHHAAWSGHPQLVTILLQASPPVRPKVTSPTPLQPRKRTAADVVNDDMDLDSDMIPDLSLPPPALPLRTYGHGYLDNKSSLVQITLGHPTTTSQQVAPMRFHRQDQPSSTKLVVSSQQDTLGAPHTVMLPLGDDRETISIFIDSLSTFTLTIDVFPTFGSRLFGRAVCLPGTFSDLKSVEAYTIPVLDTHLNVVGEVNFEASYIQHFENLQLAIGGRLETYWKSTSTEPPPISKLLGSKPLAPAQDSSFLTASSLEGDYVKVVVQVTRDYVPVTFPRWQLPPEMYDLMLNATTSRQLGALAAINSQTLQQATLPRTSSPHDWYRTLSGVIAPLQDVFAVLPDDLGLNIEVRYPTPSDCSRLDIRAPIEVNTFIDAILAVVYANTLASTGKPRRIIFSSFSPAACAALNWKQPNYAVLFSSYCGLSRSTPEGQLNPPHRTELDKRCTSIEGAVKFAKANNLLGVSLDAAIIMQVPSLVTSIKETGILLALFGAGAATLPNVDAYARSDGVLSA